MVLARNIEQEIAEDIEALVGGAAKPMAFGGAYDGAARFDKQLASWDPPRQSADLDMLPEKDTLDARTRDSLRNDAYLQGGATIHKDAIVGSVYFLNAKPVTDVLGKGLDETWAQEFQQEAEAKFMLWSESPHKWLDAARTNTFTAMVRLAVGVYVGGGEVLATAEWRREKGREFNTAIQMIDCDRLGTPAEFMNDSLVRGGIRHDDFGAPQSAYIRIRHPQDFGTFIGNADRYREVPFYKPWGRQQVIYIREQMRIDQTRAVSDMVAGLKEIAITRKFRDVTLQNAVVNAMYAASIESELPSEQVYQQLGSGNIKIGEAVTSYAEAYLGAISEYIGSAKHMKIDGVKIPHLFPGTKLKLTPAGTPGGVGQDFEQSLIRYIAASLGVSYEELSRDYTKTNYSSARAAMANTWKFMQSRKKLVADAFATAIYRLWLEEAINKNQLSTFPTKKAGMLYTNGYQNMMFEALAQCDWTGASRGQIDELKETQAAVLRIKFGLSTHEDELARLGKDWRKVYQQLERERNERERRGIELQQDNSINAASGTPSDPNSGDNTGNGDDNTGTANG
jgi:lambda family phage portal protein